MAKVEGSTAEKFLCNTYVCTYVDYSIYITSLSIFPFVLPLITSLRILAVAQKSLRFRSRKFGEEE